jgi:hypothetical protein
MQDSPVLALRGEDYLYDLLEGFAHLFIFYIAFMSQPVDFFIPDQLHFGIMGNEKAQFQRPGQFNIKPQSRFDTNFKQRCDVDLKMAPNGELENYNLSYTISSPTLLKLAFSLRKDPIT